MLEYFGENAFLKTTDKRALSNFTNGCIEFKTMLEATYTIFEMKKENEIRYKYFTDFIELCEDINLFLKDF